MARRTESKAFTKEQFIYWFENLDDNEINGGDLSVYYAYRGKCMQCGCPGDNDLMKYSVDPYYCNVCVKKNVGEDKFQSKLDRLDDYYRETKDMTIKQLMNYIKNKLFGINKNTAEPI